MKAFILVALLGIICQNSLADPTTCGFKRMRQGTNSKTSTKSEWPWMAAVMEYSRGSRSPDYLCAGTLISEAHVLTAAHCFDPRPLNPRSYSVYLETETTATGTEHDVAYVDIHPLYSPTARYYDVALITLRRDVGNDTTPVCLPQTQDEYNHRLANVLEWRTSPNGDYYPRTLQSSRALTSSNAICLRNYYSAKSKELFKGITPGQLCTQPRGPQGSCTRFTGSPMLIADRKYQWYLVGLASFRENCNGVGYPGIYTRITEYVPWIKRTARL